MATKLHNLHNYSKPCRVLSNKWGNKEEAGAWGTDTDNPKRIIYLATKINLNLFIIYIYNVHSLQ